ncbi:MAG TPA: 3-hydroxyacyl-CoA dehydrogenase family protein [Acidimicrobiia bacterium]|nr:3-hydroxyacyl-CoA dehydrogenase family protein [Acidimicrobiia bacterium]
MANLTIGVVGAGVMGSGIAQVTATAGYATTCVDVDPAALERARGHVTTGRYGFERAVERGKLTREEADAARARLVFSSSLADAATANVVIEAVPERLDLKIRLFRDLDRAAPPGTILASNTSGFSIAAIAAATDRPDRVIGWHWASPAPVMRFAEIVRTRATSDHTIRIVCDLATACRKNPIVVNDTDTKWGFVANRIYGAAIDEARRVVEEGVAEPEDVDQLMMDCFGWPAGPYTMIRGATEGWR